MSVEKLKGLLDSPDVIILDVRSRGDWAGSNSKIKGAIREISGNVKKCSDKYPKDKTLVLYCAWADEATSAGLAQKLMDRGFTKVFALKGGWHEWEQNKYPVEPK